MTTSSTKSRKKGKAAGAKSKASENGWLTAKKCDRYDLYEKSVQEPEGEVDLVEQVWKEQRDRRCLSIREDFCGSACVCMEWVKRRRDHGAIGVDLDSAVLKWARDRIPQRLTREQAVRVELVQADVLTVETEPVDSVLAMNFSYYLFTTRDRLRDYFARARGALVDDGLFLLDAYGGSDAFLELEEKRRVDGFTYIWDQHSYNPITGEALNYIHYRVPDGSELKNAFAYEWRVWTLPEILELLREVGFAKATVYWEGTDEKTGEGNDEFDPATTGEACPGWIAYIVAEK